MNYPQVLTPPGHVDPIAYGIYTSVGIDYEATLTTVCVQNYFFLRTVMWSNFHWVTAPCNQVHRSIST